MLYRLTSTAAVAVMLFVASATAQTTTGTLSGTETWSGTVTVTGDVIIEGSLTIEPGTEIKFATSNDNIVMGGTSTIYLVVMPDGVLQAHGTADNRISFTTSSLFAAAGSWGRIQVVANGDKSGMSYCDLEYQSNAVCIEKPSGVTGTSDFRMSNCNFTNGSSTAIFTSDGDSVTIDSCFINQCAKGVFHNGASYLGVFNTVIYKASCGIISAGSADYTSVVEVDHVTLYDIDLMVAGSSSRWWDGYGIFPTNTAYTLTLTNSILYQSTLANLIANSWTVVENHNCFHTGLMGLANYEDGTVNTAEGSFEGDPLFVDAPVSYALNASSPCVGTASDGGNMGAPADVIGAVNDNGIRLPAGISLQANVVEARVVFDGVSAGDRLDIYAADGSNVASVTAAGAQVAWDRNGAAAGSYLYVLTANGVATPGHVIVID